MKIAAAALRDGGHPVRARGRARRLRARRPADRPRRRLRAARRRTPSARCDAARRSGLPRRAAARGLALQGVRRERLDDRPDLRAERPARERDDRAPRPRRRAARCYAITMQVMTRRPTSSRPSCCALKEHEVDYDERARDRAHAAASRSTGTLLREPASSESPYAKAFFTLVRRARARRAAARLGRLHRRRSRAVRRGGAGLPPRSAVRARASCRGCGRSPRATSGPSVPARGRSGASRICCSRSGSGRAHRAAPSR